MLLGLAGCPGPVAPSRPPPPAPPPTPRPPPPPAPSPAPPAPHAEGSLGAKRPLAFEFASPVASWVIFCQARGDAPDEPLVRTLLLAEGGARPIVELLARDPRGRYLVVETADAVSLLDTFSGKAHELDRTTFDSRADESRHGEHRALAFDAEGKRLARLTRSPKGASVVLRELANGTERALPLGPGEVWRIEFDASGSSLVAHVVTQDTNGDGALRWPVPPRSSPLPCPGPLPTLVARAQAGDAVVPRVLDLATGRVRDRPELVARLATADVVRDDQGRLALESAGGVVPLTDDACKGRVFAADAVRARLLVACAGLGVRAPVLAVSRSGARSLDVTVGHVPVDARPAWGQRLVALHPGSSAALFDWETDTLHPLGAGRLVLARRGSGALVRDGRRLAHVRVDGEQLSSTLVASDLDAVGELLEGTHHTLVTPWVVETETGSILGRAPGFPLALDDRGRVLVAEGGEAEGRLVLGPLRYLPPTPAHSALGGKTPF